MSCENVKKVATTTPQTKFGQLLSFKKKKPFFSEKEKNTFYDKNKTQFLPLDVKSEFFKVLTKMKNPRPSAFSFHLPHLRSPTTRAYNQRSTKTNKKTFLKQEPTIFQTKTENNVRITQVKKSPQKLQLIMRSDLEGVRIWGGALK